MDKRTRASIECVIPCDWHGDEMMTRERGSSHLVENDLVRDVDPIEPRRGGYQEDAHGDDPFVFIHAEAAVVGLH